MNKYVLLSPPCEKECTSLQPVEQWKTSKGEEKIYSFHIDICYIALTNSSHRQERHPPFPTSPATNFINIPVRINLLSFSPASIFFFPFLHLHIF